MSLTKRAFDERILQVDMSPVLRDDDTIRDIISVEASGDGDPITITSITQHEKAVSFLAAGGSVGNYKVRVRVNVEGTPAQRIEGVVDLTVG